jgi:type II secretory pathway predicted ATPase ExeA
MYTAFYRLSEDPFGPDPDPRFFFESPGHKRALAYLRFGLTQDQGSVIITGARGIGKTTLIRRIAKQLEAENLVAVHFLVPPGGLPGLTAAVAQQLGIAAAGRSEAQLLSALKSHLATLRQNGKRVYVVLDEVQHLSAEALDELQRVLGLRTGSRRLMPGLLFADAEFRDTLRTPERQDLRHCTSVAYQVNPFNLEETIAYIEHRLRLVDWRDDPVFLPLAHMEVYFLSMGIPGRINRLCAQALTYAAREGLHEVKAETVDTAAAQLPPEPQSEAHGPW